MEYFREGAHRTDYTFLFDVDLISPLLLMKKTLRSEQAYDEDTNAEQTALGYLKYIVECFAGSVFLIMVGQDVARSTNLRSKKGLLWKDKELRKLVVHDLEVEAGDGKTRLVSIINLDGFSYNHSPGFVLNWNRSFIVLTELDVGSLSGYIKGWVMKDQNTVFGLLYNNVAKDLVKLGTTAALRYFPADNGRSEAIAILGNEEFVKARMEKCVDALALCDSPRSKRSPRRLG